MRGPRAWRDTGGRGGADIRILARIPGSGKGMGIAEEMGMNINTRSGPVILGMLGSFSGCVPF